MKKSLFIILSLLFVNVAFSQPSFRVGDVTYQKNSGNKEYVTVISCRGDVISVTIPETLIHNGVTYIVTAIGESAFSYCEQLKGVNLPNTITSIGGWAFFNCISLLSINLPNSLTYIGNSAFECCHSLTNISIPHKVTLIGDNAFKHCEAMTLLSYNAQDCEDFLSGNSHPFVYTPIEHIQIGDSVQRIPKNFAQNIKSLKTVNIAQGLTHIDDGAFALDDSLTTINLPNTITNLGNSIFNGCKSLTSIVIPNAIDSVGKDSFTLVSGVFEGCTSLTNVTLGKGLIYIAENTFKNCNALQTVTVLAPTPPELPFLNHNFPSPNNADLIVACGAVQEYASSPAWSHYFTNNITEIVYDVVVSSNDENKGVVTMQRDCSSATLTATANTCFQFHSWNDGNTENPRVIELDSDTNLVAIFGEIRNIIDTTINEGEVYTDYGFNESEQGTYYQYFTTDNGCDSVIVLNLSVNVSLNDVKESSLSLYPNPTSKELYFSDMIKECEVMDFTGKRVMKFYNTKSINIESLPAGFYYLKLIYKDKILIKKVIKQ